jgi:hypothetical protein
MGLPALVRSSSTRALRELRVLRAVEAGPVLLNELCATDRVVVQGRSKDSSPPKLDIVLIFTTAAFLIHGNKTRKASEKDARNWC